MVAPTRGAPVTGLAAYRLLVRSTRGLTFFIPGIVSPKYSSGSNYVLPARFTLECWVKVPSSGGSNLGLLTCWTASTGVMLFIEATTVTFMFRVNGTDLDSGMRYPLNALTNGAYMHCVGTYDGTSRSIFINGQLTNGPTSGVAITPAATPLLTHDGTGGAAFTGIVADPAIYARALTAAEVQAHYRAGAR
jgi:hypothetical protein